MDFRIAVFVLEKSPVSWIVAQKKCEKSAKVVIIQFLRCQHRWMNCFDHKFSSHQISRDTIDYGAIRTWNLLALDKSEAELRAVTFPFNSFEGENKEEENWGKSPCVQMKNRFF